MPFLGTIVNFLTVFVCGLVGLLIKKGIPKRVADALQKALAICVIYIGVSGTLETAPAIGNQLLSDELVKILIMVISMALGTLIGEIIDIDKWVNRLGEGLEKKLVKKGEKGKFAEGFIYCSMLFCVGAMTINGSFQDAKGNPDILIAKSVIDGIVCLSVASTLGVGCVASAFFVLAYQGILTAIGLFAVEFLPAESLTYMSVTGSLVVILIGTNMLGATKVKTANMIPALFIPALIYRIFTLFS